MEPRAWQTEALQTWGTTMRGVVAAVTGAGKTTFTFLCIDFFLKKVRAGRVLIIVPTTSLLDQWAIALADEFGIDPTRIGLIGGGKRKGTDRQFVICVINSARKFSEVMSKAGPAFLVVDECHRAGSSENSKALAGEFVATLGLSATPERQYDSGFEDLVSPALGGVVFRYGYEEAFRDGIIVPFDVVNVKFCLSESEQREYARLTKLIARNMNPRTDEQKDRLDALMRQRARVSWNSPLRVPLAVRLALKHKAERMIVFHESVEKATETNELLCLKGVRSTIYHTGLGEATRRENLRLFKRGYFTCMVCCRALDEGLNVPRTSVGIVACSTSSTRQRIQRLGRILRQAEGKGNATVYTLFATEPEEERLRIEENEMKEFASFKWLSAEVKARG
jgi:superfamily II DNA or RNA helicase